MLLVGMFILLTDSRSTSFTTAYQDHPPARDCPQTLLHISQHITARPAGRKFEVGNGHARWHSGWGLGGSAEVGIVSCALRRGLMIGQSIGEYAVSIDDPATSPCTAELSSQAQAKGVRMGLRLPLPVRKNVEQVNLLSGRTSGAIEWQCPRNRVAATPWGCNNIPGMARNVRQGDYPKNLS